MKKKVRNKLGQFVKGHPPFVSDEIAQKISETLKRLFKEGKLFHPKGKLNPLWQNKNQMITKYPRLPFELNKNRKLSDEDIEYIQEAHKNKKFTNIKLAMMFNVAESSIKYWVYPKLHENNLKRARKYNKERYYYLKNNNPKEFKERERRIWYLHGLACKRYPPQAKYHNDISKRKELQQRGEWL